MSSAIERTAALDLLIYRPLLPVKQASAVQRAAAEDVIGMEKEAVLPLLALAVPAVFGALSAWDVAKGVHGIATGREGAWSDLGWGAFGLATGGLGGAAAKGARLLKGVSSASKLKGVADIGAKGLAGFRRTVRPFENISAAIGKPITDFAHKIKLDKIPLVGPMMFGGGRMGNVVMGGQALGLGIPLAMGLLGGGSKSKGISAGGEMGGGPGFTSPHNQEIKNVAPTPEFAPPISPQPLTPQPYENQTAPQEPPPVFKATSPMAGQGA